MKHLVRTLRYCLVAAAALLCVESVAVAQQTGGNLLLTVAIVDELTPKPVPYTDFKITSAGGSVPDKVLRTDEKGSLAVLLPPGTYTIANVQPVTFKGHTYSWSKMFTIEDGKDCVLKLIDADATTTVQEDDPFVPDKPSGGSGSPAGLYVPASTTVAIIPVVNASGEKDINFKSRQIESGMTYLTKEFADRGFRVLDQAAVTRALADLKFDINDEENYNKPTLYKIGKQVNADLVVFAVITNTEQHIDIKVFVTTREGRATVKMWLLDAKNESAVLSAATRLGKSGGPGGMAIKKGSDEINHAVANAERDLLKDFFQPYPLLKKGR